MPYKVLVDDLTVNADGAEITDLFGNVIGHQTVSVTYRKGTVLEDDQVGEALRQSVEVGDTEGYLEEVGDKELSDSRVVGEPFPGYDDLDVEQVQVLFKTLPSEAIRSVVEYEALNQRRSGIVDYHIGRGEAFTDRLEGRAGSPAQDGAEKEVLSGIVTREVGEDSFVFGESLSDDGQPQIPFGAKEGDDSDEGGEQATTVADAAIAEVAKAADADEDEKAAPRGRRGRRAAAKQATSTPRSSTDADQPGGKDEDKG